ncbi:MAG: SCO family protein [Myxococcota bacterium]
MWTKKTVIGVGLSMVITGGIFYSLCQPKHDLPPILLQVKPWSLIDHNAKAFGSKQLEGKVWIANFFFTRCPTICPELINKMAQLQKNLAHQAQAISFVSFSVDPEHDTPQVLQQYRSQKQLDALPNWTFVTGGKKQLYELVVQQMKLHVGEKQPLQDGSERFDIGHVAHFVLFDQQGNMRGLFNTTPQGLQDLQRNAHMLIRNAIPKHP